LCEQGRERGEEEEDEEDARCAERVPVQDRLPRARRRMLEHRPHILDEPLDVHPRRPLIERALPRALKVEADDGEARREVVGEREEVGRAAEAVQDDEGRAGAGDFDEEGAAADRDEGGGHGEEEEGEGEGKEGETSESREDRAGGGRVDRARLRASGKGEQLHEDEEEGKERTHVD